MLGNQEKVAGVLKTIRQFIPSFNISLKSQSLLHRVIGWVLNKTGNPKYMFCYWTTLGSWTARPQICDNGATIDEWRILLHEGKHAVDSKKLGLLLFSFIYLFPQILGILAAIYSLAAVIALFFGAPISLLWGLLGLVFLAPIPAVGRAILEARAYKVSLAVELWSGNLKNEESYLNWLETVFIDGSYYYMFPFKSIVRKYFNSILNKLKTNTLNLDSYLTVCKVLSLQYKEPNL